MNKLDLESVRDAIGRAEAIMDNREKDGCTLLEYKGFMYYKENPSLEVWKAIKIIPIKIQCISKCKKHIAS